MYTYIFKVLIFILGITSAAFGVSAYFMFLESTTPMGKAFHLLHVIIVLLGFIISYFAYKKYKHLL